MTLHHLIADVAAARERAIQSVQNLTPAQSTCKPSPEAWSACEIMEHLVLAEISGVTKIWQAVIDSRDIPHTNLGLSIEEIVERTWRPREIAPPIATPHIGGPLDYWIAALRFQQPVLDAVGQVLEGRDLQSIVYPHFLCGPLDAGQRIEFLRFHIDRHVEQIEKLNLAQQIG